MDTPICNFVRQYADNDTLRLHMPGHKGMAYLGMEQLDITEIDGADSLYEASGIIQQSEKNASRIFGCSTFYSTEGSSQCIRAMLYLALLHAKQNGRKPLIAAARNVHKVFLSAAALLDLEVMWLYPDKGDSYLSCVLDAASLDAAVQQMTEKPAAVYLTSPDYLGNLTDVSGIAEVCHRHNILLLVDNAHGAYLKFLTDSLHPIDLGADLCCDSAHKTLPVLTGGAYLHISPSLSESLLNQAKNALSLFGSTSPSYLILQSLDAANQYLTDYSRKLNSFCPEIQKMKANLIDHGYIFSCSEVLKLTIQAKPYGYTGNALARILSNKGIVCEFSDPDHLVLMLTPEIGLSGLDKLEQALLSIPPKAPIADMPPVPIRREAVISIRDALLSPAEVIPVQESCGRIFAAATVGCPPAVPILICGERIDEYAIACFRYYGIHHCSVVAKRL